MYSTINFWIGFGEAPRSSLISKQRGLRAPAGSLCPTLPCRCLFNRIVLTSNSGDLKFDTMHRTVAATVSPVQHSVRGVMAALRRAFQTFDKKLKSNFEVLRDRSGTTCTAVLVSPSHWYFANLGDSRAVLCRNGRPHYATHDHKPTEPREVRRIMAAGGTLFFPSCWGVVKKGMLLIYIKKGCTTRWYRSTIRAHARFYFPTCLLICSAPHCMSLLPAATACG